MLCHVLCACALCVSVYVYISQYVCVCFHVYSHLHVNVGNFWSRNEEMNFSIEVWIQSVLLHGCLSFLLANFHHTVRVRTYKQKHQKVHIRI